MVLVVDDDPAVRELLVEMLRSLGYRVIEAPHGRAGLELLEGEPCPDMMIVDYLMPGMSGAEVALAARRAHPELPILFSTGYADTGALQGALADLPVLRKPFRLADLASSVASSLASARRLGGGTRPIRSSRAPERSTLPRCKWPALWHQVPVRWGSALTSKPAEGGAKLLR